VPDLSFINHPGSETDPPRLPDPPRAASYSTAEISPQFSTPELHSTEGLAVATVRNVAQISVMVETSIMTVMVLVDDSAMS
jgi:hypothetical protein